MKRLTSTSLIDIKLWPEVCIDALPQDEAEIVANRVLAMKMYFEGKPLSEIAAVTGLERQRVNALYHKCISLHSDGRIFGFRGCLYYCRVKKMERVKPSPAITQNAQYGHSGLLGQLFARFPHIRAEILEKALSTGKGANERLLRYRSIHKHFIKMCKAAGIEQCDFPLNTESKCERGLARWLKNELNLGNVRRSIRARYGEEAMIRHRDDRPTRLGFELLAMEHSDFDGHNLDAVGILRMRIPSMSEPIKLVLRRIWLLLVMDRASRAVLGYYVSFGRNYSAQDVLTCMQNAVVPWVPRRLAIPGINYREEWGLPSQKIPELAYALWGTLSYDNAKAHLAGWTWENISKKLGCTINPGMVKQPEGRILIERLFKRLEQRGFQRLPSTVGSKPDDPRKGIPDGAAMQFNITIEELLDLIDLIIAEYNAEPHGGLFGMSPLEFLRSAVDNESIFVKTVPEEERSGFNMTSFRENGTVRGNFSKHEPLHVNFYGAKYYSPKLLNSQEMEDKDIVIEANASEMRPIKIFREDGSEFDVLTVEQRWAGTPHDLRMRLAALKALRTGKLRVQEGSDVMSDYLEIKETEALESSSARSELAHMRRLVGEAKKLKQEKSKKMKTKVQPPLFPLADDCPPIRGTNY